LRIALIVERFEPDGGGLEHAAWRTAHALAAAGDEVTVVARSASPQPTPAVELALLPVPTFWQPLRVRRFAARASSWIARARRSGRIDLAHAWSRVPGADVFHGGEGSHWHYLRRTHGERGARWRRSSPRHATLLQLERRIFSAPALHLQSVSAMVERELSARFALAPERLHRVAYGVDLARFAPDGGEARSAVRRELDPEAGAGDATTFLLAGSGWRRKGLDSALGALAGSATGQARLWIAGGDDPRPWRRRAERLGVAGRLRFLGRRHDLERVYRAADALVLPARYDAFGLVCLEAAASGLPLVLSGATGAAELLADASLVVDDPEDVAGFADALDRLCDPGVRKPLGERARAIAREHDWSRQTERLRALYERVRGGGT
jgi:UDP-glucose:(heptosyl)LPS alpha-1,3-glucosyltransferase